LCLILFFIYYKGLGWIWLLDPKVLASI